MNSRIKNDCATFFDMLCEEIDSGRADSGLVSAVASHPHLEACPECRKTCAALMAAREGLSQLPRLAGETAPPELLTGVMKAIESEEISGKSDKYSNDSGDATDGTAKTAGSRESRIINLRTLAFIAACAVIVFAAYLIKPSSPPVNTTMMAADAQMYDAGGEASARNSKDAAGTGGVEDEAEDDAAFDGTEGAETLADKNDADSYNGFSQKPADARAELDTFIESHKNALDKNPAITGSSSSYEYSMMAAGIAPDVLSGILRAYDFVEDDEAYVAELPLEDLYYVFLSVRDRGSEIVLAKGEGELCLAVLIK